MFVSLVTSSLETEYLNPENDIEEALESCVGTNIEDAKDNN